MIAAEGSSAALAFQRLIYPEFCGAIPHAPGSTMPLKAHAMPPCCLAVARQRKVRGHPLSCRLPLRFPWLKPSTLARRAEWRLATRGSGVDLRDAQPTDTAVAPVTLNKATNADHAAAEVNRRYASSRHLSCKVELLIGRHEDATCAC